MLACSVRAYPRMCRSMEGRRLGPDSSALSSVLLFFPKMTVINQCSQSDGAACTIRRGAAGHRAAPRKAKHPRCCGCGIRRRSLP